uniref:Olfactomedin-like domain-containing protein n=1 Tax=Plectus sambesii TaxID=2011161 RepID=A0A914WZU4_9BILA
MARSVEGCGCRRHLVVVYTVQSALLLIFALLYWSICLDLSAIRTDLRVARAQTEQLERFITAPKTRERRDASSQYYHVDQGMNDALVIGGAVHIEEPKLLLPIYAKVSQGTLEALCPKSNNANEQHPPCPCGSESEQGANGDSKRTEKKQQSAEINATEAPSSSETDSQGSLSSTASRTTAAADDAGKSIESTITTPATRRKQTSSESKETRKGMMDRRKLHKRIGRRKKKCTIVDVGAPATLTIRMTYYGAWMADSMAPDERTLEKIYLTEHYMGTELLEYSNATQLVNGLNNAIYSLPDITFDGTNHIVYNGSFYFHRTGTDKVVRYELLTGRSTERSIKNANHRGETYLYLSNESYSYLDLAADENGLWLLYRRQGRGYLTVAKLDPWTLEKLAKWNLQKIRPKQLVNAFVACGVVYAVGQTDDGKALKVVATYDLYKQRYEKPNQQLIWKTPHNRVKMIEYDWPRAAINVYDYGNIYSLKLKMANSLSSENY